tara:strand:- start:2589 stop:3434 length:846 start_codon:yes stop_codon:yes gene_type:complete
MSENQDHEVSFETIVDFLKQNFRFISILTFMFACLSIFYALSIDKYYKSNLLMTSSLSSGNQSSLIGGLLGSSDKPSISSGKITSEEAIAILGSRKFLEKFVLDRDLLKILFSSSWDNQNSVWIGLNEESPQIKDGYELISDSLSIDFDKSLITLTLIFHDGDEVSKILNNLVDDVNDHLRNLAIAESSLNIDFLREEINKTQLAASKEMLYRLVESQTQSIMIANTRKDYAFKIIDPAVKPESPAGPNRKLIVIIGSILGGILSIAISLVLNFYKKYKST